MLNSFVLLVQSRSHRNPILTWLTSIPQFCLDYIYVRPDRSTRVEPRIITTKCTNGKSNREYPAITRWEAGVLALSAAKRLMRCFSSLGLRLMLESCRISVKSCVFVFVS
jgi:hypothetical protein